MASQITPASTAPSFRSAATSVDGRLEDRYALAKGVPSCPFSRERRERVYPWQQRRARFIEIRMRPESKSSSERILSGLPLGTATIGPHPRHRDRLTNQAIVLGHVQIAFVRRQEHVSLAGDFEVRQQGVRPAILDFEWWTRLALILDVDGLQRLFQAARAIHNKRRPRRGLAGTAAAQKQQAQPERAAPRRMR